MKPTFKSRELTFLFQNTIITIILFGVHSYILSYFAQDIDFFFPVWQIYVFNFVVTTLFYTVVNYQYSKGKRDVFNLFMLSTIVKMLLAIVFLLPLIVSDFQNKQPDVFNFFIVYFLYLFFEIYAITQFLQKKP